ncbi:membrane-bound lytic murein transglycosylase A [Polynucleobacter kasalickyi]|uniref:peptidoglycan lytic exotransglycosylase n=2 Tax=Polynucleobacter kasalickyi TaxID=1938817 RepID=A0A1W2AEW9_9BURK|nr:membrane-bound lytic murein transglycosylase A [Polynucleobacter kasalickyi]
MKMRMNKAIPASATNKRMGYSSNKSASIGDLLLKLINELFRKHRKYAFLISSILLISCAHREPSVVKSSQNNSTVSDVAVLMHESTNLSSLPGWNNDSMEDVWVTWQKSCNYIQKAMKHSPLYTACIAATHVKNPTNTEIKQYFENHFQAMPLHQVEPTQGYAQGSSLGLITGYYEPILKGSLTRTRHYQIPLHQYPTGWQSDQKLMRPTRAELLQSGKLKGSELVWVNDPVAAAFMQIQGSGKIQLENGKILRLGFAGTNNQSYASIGNWLIQQKELTASQASMQNIAAWARSHPERVSDLLNANPRYVFFRVLQSKSNEEGPIGALNEPLTAQRSIAVDWQYIPKGSPVFLSTSDPKTGKKIERLVFAQDTGNAIVGSVRADFYWGSGDAAGEKAGMTKQSGSMWLLKPKIK